MRSHLRHSHHGNGARRGEEHERTDASVQRGSPGSGQGPHTFPPQIWAWRRLIAGLQKQGAADAGGQRSDPDRPLETARRHEWTRSAIMRGSAGSIGRTNPSKLASLWRSTGWRKRPSRERAAIVGSSTQVRQSTTDPTLSRTPTVAGHPTRQVGSGERMLRAVTVWLGKILEARSGCRLCGARQCNVWRWLRG